MALEAERKRDNAFILLHISDERGFLFYLLSKKLASSIDTAVPGPLLSFPAQSQ